MADLDSLNIQIKADSQSAISSIDNLISRLGTLSQSITRLDVSGLNNLTNGVSNLASAMSAYKTSGVSASTFASIASGLGKLNSINASQMGMIASSVNRLGTALNQFNVASNTATSIATVANAIGQLGKQTTNNATANIPLLSQNLNGLVSELNKFQSISFDIGSFSQFASTISRLGSKSSQAATTGIPQLTDSVKKMLIELSNAPQVSRNVIDLINAMAKLQSASSRTGKSANNVANGLNNISSSSKRASRSIGSFGNGIKGMQLKFGGLSRAIGKFYASMFLVIRGIKGLWRSVDASMDYLEVVNYYNQAMRNISRKVTAQWKQLGYDSAEAYFSQFTSSMSTLMKQMTGYTIAANGALEQTADTISLGINPTKLIQFQTTFAQMADSIGEAEEYTIKLSNAMTMLGSDLASVRNMNFEDTWGNLSSGVMSGMSRALDKYGINVRSAALQQKMLSLGIETSVQNLGQEEKALLRAIVAIESSEYAWGDLANTISSPANALRQLKSNWQLLGQYVGDIFLPIVAKVIPFLNAFTLALQKVSLAIKNYFGIQDIDWGAASSGFDDTISDIYDEAENAAEGINDASKSMDKLKKSLLGFDEINKLSGDDTSAKGTDASGQYLSTLQNAFDQVYNKYQEAWNKAVDSVDSDTQTLADDIYNNLKTAFTSQSWSKLGEDIGGFLKDGIDNINPNDVGSTLGGILRRAITFAGGLMNSDLFTSGFSNLATIVSTSINTIFANKRDWSELGSGISNIINAITNGLGTLATTTDFSSVGDGIATAIGTNIDSTRWDLQIENVGKILDGIATALSSFATSHDWKGTVKDFVLGINDGLKDFSKDDLADILSNLGTFAGEIIGALLGALLDPNTLLDVLETIGTIIVNLVKGVFGFIGSLATGIFDGAFGDKSDIETFGVEITKETQADIDALKSASNSIKNGMDNVRKSFDDANNSAEANTAYLSDIVDKYMTIAKKTNKTAQDYAEMESLRSLIAEEDSSIAKVIDDETLSYEEQAKAIKDIIKQLKLKAKAEAANEALKDAYKVQIDAEHNLEEALKKVNEQEKKRKFAQENLIDYAQRLKDAQDRLSSAEATYQANKTGWAKRNLDDAQKAVNAMQDQYDKAQLYFDTEELGYQSLVDAADEAQVALSQAQEEVGFYADKLTDFNTEMNNVADGIANGIKTSMAGVPSYLGTEIDKATGSIKVNGAKTVREAGVLGKDINKSFKSEIKLGTAVGDSLTNAKNKFANNTSVASQATKSGRAVKSNYVSSMAGIPTSIQDKLNLAKEVVENSGDTTKRNSIASKAKSASEKIASKYVSSMAGMPSELRQYAVDSLNKLSEGSQDRRALGDVQDKAIAIASTMTTPIGAAEAQMKNMAKNIVYGVANGLSEGMGDNAKYVAKRDAFVNDIWEEFSKKYQIHSPSRLFKKYGFFIVEGLNIGITDNMESTESIMEEWYKSIPQYEPSDLIDTNSFRNMSVNTNVSATQTIVGGTLNSLVNAVNSLLNREQSVTVDVSLEGDARGLFKSVQNQAKVYSTQTGKMAFT